MCRWLAYSGPPVRPDTFLFEAENSLIQQSLSAQMAVTPTNGDGFGLGWYGSAPQPGLFRDVLPAWNDENLKCVAEQVQCGLFFAHVRASTGAGISRSNCHPFRFDNWLFMHNGMVSDFEILRRDLSMMIAPELYPELRGTTDSEVLFFLALTNGLRDDPVVAIERTVAQTLEAMKARKVDGPLRMTAVVTDGSAVYALRFASDDEAPTLYYGLGVQPETGNVEPSQDAGGILILSEPLDAEQARWVAVPQSHILIAGDGGVAVNPFSPQ